MPRASLRPCTYPGCNNIGDGPRCPLHPNRKVDKRLGADKRGYDNDWHVLRRLFLRQHPVCQIRVKCYGSPATEVDHIKPLTMGGNRLDSDNLQAACGTCHKWKTNTIDKPAQVEAGIRPGELYRRPRR